MNNRLLHQAVMRRFSEHHNTAEACPATVPPGPGVALNGAAPRHLSRFLKMAEHRKRQMLEKMLLDSPGDAG